MARKLLPIWMMVLSFFLLLVVVAWSVSAAPAGTGPIRAASVLPWQLTTVASTGDVGQYSSLALNSAGQPHVSYFDNTNGFLKYAHYDGSTWQVETVDSTAGVGKHTSLALDSAGRPHISYHDETKGHLKYAYYDGSTWQIETVDTNGGYVGRYTSLALDSSGRPHISYYHYSTTEVPKYAYYNGSDWEIWVVDWTGDAGQYTSLALDSADRPHISYYDFSPTGELKYAYFDGSNWQIETVDSPGVGQYTSLALDSSGRPHISYYDDANDDLEYAYYDGSAWQLATVDSTGTVGSHTSLVLDSGDNPHISYYDDNTDDLKYAYYDGSAWQLDTVDNTAAVGTYTSLALDSAGHPHVSYYDGATNNDLKYASPVELSFHHRAAQHLEEMRGSEMAPGWDNAQLGSGVRPLYRPDVNGVAYYEFPVEAPASAQVEAAASQPAGFIIVSTGEHDFPIPDWNFAGKSPTQRLEEIATAGGQTAVKFYKLDALAYAAENAQGTQVATLGEQPSKISGMQLSWLDQPPETTQSEWIPDQHGPDDSTADQVSGTLVISGTGTPPSLQLSAWSSWNELKTGYSSSYNVLNEALRRNASEEWQAQSEISQYGIVLFKGDVYSLALLWPGPTVSTSGAGVGYVQTELVTRSGLSSAQDGLPPVYRITVTDSVMGEQLPLNVTISYQNGVTETVNFLIVGPFTAWLPLITRDYTGETTLATQSTPEVEAQAHWGVWHYAWASGGHSSQRIYDQIPAYSYPNSSSCPSGCGATAWAMLFGWGDYRASASVDDVRWSGRSGLYLTDGGGPGSVDAVAPRTMDGGVKNMIWEIRNDIDTWCIGDSGPTWPSDMSQASSYLAGRTYTTLRDEHCITIPGLALDSIRNKAIHAVRDRATPAIIGIGLLEHYPLAYGYAYRHRYSWTGRVIYRTSHWFYINNGWGDVDENRWVEAETWYYGEIFP